MALSELARQVQAHLAQHMLCAPGHSLLLAVSGGADSVAMTYLLRELGYQLELVHVNFGLRGAASDEDEAYVAQLAQQLQVPVHIHRPDTRAYAEANHLSLQVAARQLRYAFFEQVLHATGAHALATAHHRNDVAESVLYGLVRSKEFAVLHGIPVRRGRYIRPVLFAAKQALQAYLAERGLAWREDASNANPAVPRAFIRHDVIPRLEQLNPSLSEQLSERLQLYSLQLHVLRELIDSRLPRYWHERPNAEGHSTHISIDIDALLRREGAAFTALLLYQALEQRLGFSHAEVRRTRELLLSQTGRSLEAQGWRITRDRGYLLLERTSDSTVAPPPLALQPGEQRWGPWRIRMSETEDPAAISTLVPPPPPGVVWMDADAASDSLHIRAWQPGDRLRPIHLGGEKKVSDILTELKRRGAARTESFVIASGENVLYLEGYRIDERVAIGPHTQRVLELRFFLQDRSAGHTA